MATADEIVSESEKLGAKFNKRTLYNYTASKCIPEPRRGAGYGGKWVEYDKLDFVWATIAWRMIHGVYPESHDSEDILYGIKPPRIPPKTISVLHNEFIKRGNEILQIKLSCRTEITQYVAKNCWKEKDDANPEVMILRGMMAWYVISFLNVVFSMARLEMTKEDEEFSMDVFFVDIIFSMTRKEIFGEFESDGKFEQLKKEHRYFANGLEKINKYIMNLSIE